MKRVVIVNAGERGELSAAKGSYDRLVDVLQEQIGGLKQATYPGEPAASVEVVGSVAGTEHLLNRTDVLIFVTAGLLDAARHIKQSHPRLKVVVLTGLLPEDEIILVDKRWLDDELIRGLILS